MEDTIESVIVSKYREAEEKLLKDILRTYLEREPTDEDAKLITKYAEAGNFDYYFLAIEGMKVGKVTIKHYSPFDPVPSMGYDFELCSHEHLGKPAVALVGGVFKVTF